MNPLLRALAIVLVVAAVAFGLLWLRLDAVAKLAVERGGSQALGVETTLGGVQLGLLSGSLGLRGLRVANPPGFQSPHFLALERGRVEVELGSLLRDTKAVPLLALRGVDLRLESRAGRTNYGAILAHVKRFEAGAPPAAAEAPGGGARIARIAVHDVRAHLRVSGPAGLGQELEILIPEIRLQNVGTGTGGGVVVAQVADVVVKAILDAVLRSGGDLPVAVARELRAGLRGLEGVRYELAGEVVRRGAKAAGQVGQQLEEAVGGAAEKALRDLGGLVEKGGGPAP